MNDLCEIWLQEPVTVTNCFRIRKTVGQRQPDEQQSVMLSIIKTK